MPQQRDPRIHPGAFIGRRLQRARIKAGYSSQDALAAKIGTDRTVIAKAESGERPPTDDVLAAWCELTRLDYDLYSDFCELARVTNGSIPEWFKPWIAAEREATSLRIWHGVLVPGLFHTEAYARAILAVDGGDTDALVQARLERSKILDRPGPPDVVAVIDEMVLRRMIGSAEVMREQPACLADVRRASVAFDQIRAEALPRGQSRDLIVRLGEELWRPKELAARARPPIPTAAVRRAWKSARPRTLLPSATPKTAEPARCFVFPPTHSARSWARSS